jgi:hypothetical protein
MVSSYLAKPSFFHITRTNDFGPFPFIADNYAWVLSYTYYDKSYGWGIGNMINQRITVAETEGGAKRSPTENS